MTPNKCTECKRIIILDEHRFFLFRYVDSYGKCTYVKQIPQWKSISRYETNNNFYSDIFHISFNIFLGGNFKNG